MNQNKKFFFDPWWEITAATIQIQDYAEKW